MKLAASGTPVLGVCGGYQMLGETLADPEGTESGTAQTVQGLCCPHGLYRPEAPHPGHCRRRRPLPGAALTGYQIHTGRTEVQGVPFCTLADGTPEGCDAEHNVQFGTYLQPV